jgi:hypothetical protein
VLEHSFPERNQKMKNRQTIQSCPVCGSSKLKTFYEIEDVPASCNILWDTKYAAVNCPKGDLRLAFCPRCTFIVNSAIEPEKNQYGRLYDNSLFYSPHFQNFAKGMATDLIQRYNLHNKTVVEVGGGKVDFLSFFCEYGNNQGLRLSPTKLEKEFECQNKNKFNGTAQPSRNRSDEHFEVDFVFSYHELEHLNNPASFLNALRQMLVHSPNVSIFFAVPNAKKSFEEGDYTDIMYEHVSYFTVPSLCFLFSQCGFDVTEVTESKNAIFDSIYITATREKQIKSIYKLNSQLSPNRIEFITFSFGSKSKRILENLMQRVKGLLNKGKRVILWGAGSRGVTILNIIKDSRIEYAVDINPRKQGKYMPGTGQSIVAPNFLVDYKPDYVIIANPAYENEIRQTIGNLRIEPEFILI